MGHLVLATQAVCADANQIGSHSYGVGREPYLGTCLVRPVDRHLSDMIAPPSCHEQNLDIKTEPIHPHTREEVLRHFRAEHLESALRVLDTTIG